MYKFIYLHNLTTLIGKSYYYIDNKINYKNVLLIKIQYTLHTYYTHTKLIYLIFIWNRDPLPSFLFLCQSHCPSSHSCCWLSIFHTHIWTKKERKKKQRERRREGGDHWHIDVIVYPKAILSHSALTSCLPLAGWNVIRTGWLFRYSLPLESGVGRTIEEPQETLLGSNVSWGLLRVGAREWWGSHSANSSHFERAEGGPAVLAHFPILDKKLSSFGGWGGIEWGNLGRTKINQRK